METYGYDIRGNQNQLNNALGYTWNYRYDLVDQLTASVDPEGKATEYAYNLVGELASVTKPGERTTSFGYDGNYNPTAITDPKGYLYGYTYDKDNRLTGTKNPLGETTTTAYDPGSRITSETDRMGLTEGYTYDAHGNTLSVKATNGLITRFSYDILDNLVKVTMPSDLTATYTYDVMGNVTGATDTMKRTTEYTYDAENNMTSVTDPMGRKETMSYDIGGRTTGYTSNGGNKIHYDYDRLNDLVEKSYEDARDPEKKEGVLYAYDVTGQRVSMMDRSGESKYEYDGLGRITKVTTGSGEVTEYAYDGSDQLESITYADGKKVSYQYDKNDNLTQVTDRTGAVTTYVYDAINRVTEIHRPNGVSTYNTYNARDQITDMKNLCDDCGWTVSEYHYTYDDRGFITGEDVTESLYGYAWDDKHDGKHENWHDDLYPHGDKHYNKHDKDGVYGFQIIGTKRAFEYDDDGKLTRATEKEDRQGTYVYDYVYDDMGNRTSYKKARNGVTQEGAEYTYNAANQMTAARLYDGKHYKNVEYTYDADGNRTMQEEVKPDGTRKVELTYDYSVEDRLKAVHDKNDLLVAMAYDGDGNRIFQLNYNLHTDDDWKGNSGNGNGNNKDNTGSGNSGNTSGNGTGSKDKNKDKGNNGNGNGKGNNGKGNGNSGNNGNGNGNSGNKPNGNTSTGGVNDNNGNANGNTNNTGGSTNQSGILFPIDGEVSELEGELIGMIKTTGKEKDYELVEYVNDVNREHTEVLMELNINGIMDTAYSYGNERLTNERFTEWTGYYTYDPRGSVSGVTDSKGMIWQSYRYDANGDMTFGKPQYNNVYSYNAESYNPNFESQYLRARYYNVPNANFLTEDSYLGNITDPLSLNRYNYVKSSPMNYVDPSGHYASGDSNNPASSNYKTPSYEDVFGADWNRSTTKLKTQLGKGNITLSKPGSKIQISMSLAEDNGEIDLCKVGKQAGSFLLGMYVANMGYTDNVAAWAVDRWMIPDFAKNLLKLGEDYAAETFLDSEMYYTGKYIVDALQYAGTYGAAKIMEELNDIFSGNNAGFQGAAQMGITAGLLYGSSGSTSAGAMITAGGEIVTDTAVAVGVTGVSVVIGGVLVMTIQASTNSTSQERMEEDKKKADASKGESETGQKKNPTKGESNVWKELDNVKGQDRKTSGTGKNKQYYEWDHTHNDIEVYDRKGNHLGSMDPTTGEMYKPAVPGRTIKIN